MTQYLILHKVRGEPSFDCATQMEVNGETFWVTNAGHRAYPVTAHELSFIIERCEIGVANVPDDWPEHFAISDKPIAKKGTGLNIMDFIKIPQPTVKLRRRI